MACPNKNLPEYKKLVQEYGAGRALALWERNNEQVPTIEQAKAIVRPVDYSEGVDRILKGFPALRPAYPGSRTMYNYFTTVKNTRASNKAIAEGIRKFIGKNPHLQSVGVLTDYGNHNIIQLVNRNHKLYSDVTDTGKITNVNFTVSREERQLYDRRTADIIKDISKDPRVLLMQGDSAISTTSTTLQSHKEFPEGFLQASEQLLQLPASNTNVKSLMEKTLSELFNSPDRADSAYTHAIGYFIASRLLQESDSFSGRVLASLSKDRMVANNYVRIENNPNPKEGLYYFDGKGIYINLAKLPQELDKFNDFESFIRGTELVLTEEVIHAVANALSSNREMEQVYQELTNEEREQFSKTYNTADMPHVDIAHEYIRTIIQEDIFGTSTARELKTKEKNVILRALRYIIDLFKGSADRTSVKVVETIKAYINKITNNQYQLSSTKSEPLGQLNSQLTQVVQSLGGQVNIVPNIVVQGKVISANAMTDVYNKTVDLADGKIQADTLPEEVAHIWVHWLPKNSLILRDMMSDIRSRPLYQQTMDEYSNNVHYQHADGTVDEDKIAKEAIGKLIAGTIVKQYKDQRARTLLQRLLDWIRAIFKGKSLDSYQQVASDILAGNTKQLDNVIQSKVNRTVSQGLSKSTGKTETNLNLDGERAGMEGANKERLSTGRISDQQESTLNEGTGGEERTGISISDRGRDRQESGRVRSKQEEANRQGQYYFQLTGDEISIINSQMSKATAVQQAIIKDVYLEPHSRIILDKTTHTYSDLGIVNPTVYTSVTTAISGNKSLEGYEDNQQWGNDFDSILQDIIQGKDIRETSSLAPEVRDQLIPYLQGVIYGLTSDGSIALTQVIVADKDSKIAGSIDLLLVDPFGNMKVIDLKTSWNSIQDSQYTKKWNTGEGSKLTGALSKSQQHSIQVGVYAKLVELMGYPVRDRRTYHLLLDTADGIVTGYTDQGMVQHPSSENEDKVNTIVPTVYQGKNRLAELRGEPQPIPEDNAQRALNAEELQDRIHKGILPAYESWRDYLNSLKHEVGFIPQDETIRKVDDLLTYMEQEYNETGGYSRIYTKFLAAAQVQLTGIMNYLGNKENTGKPDYVRVIFLAKKYVDTFKGLFHTEKFATPDQHRLYVNVEQTLRNVNEVIVQAVKDNNKNLLATWSTNPLYTDKTPITLPDGTQSTKGQQALSEALERNKDISQTTMIMDTIGNSGVPLLENVSKNIADARATEIENSHHIIEDIHQAANNLKQVMGIGDVKGILSTDNSRKLYDWMFQRDSKGKKNGQVISQIGTLYKEVQNGVNEPLWHIQDGKLTRKEYIEGDNLTDEQLAWNKELWKLKRAKSDFMAPEIVTGDRTSRKVTSTDGAYHELTSEFRAQRELYMKQDPRRYGKWVAKNEKDPAYIAWRAANYDWVQYVGPVMKFNRKTKEMEPTGQVEYKMDYFIKSSNSRSRMETNDGQLLWDKEYARIMRGQTAVDKAQKAYYEQYISTMRKQVEKLPAGAMSWFEQGYIPMIGANWVQMLSSKDVRMASVITDQLTNFFEVTAYTAQDDRVKTGTPTQSIPIMYMGTLQSQKRVQQLQEEISKWAQKKTTTNLKLWHEHNDKLIDSLKRESSKMTADQLHPDLTVGLEAFVHMSENFHVMSAIEDKVLAAKEQLKVMEFEKKNGTVVQGTESNAFRLYSHVLDNIFYGEQAAHSFTEQFISHIMKVTSAISIPLNIFGMLNNKFVARVNNRIDSMGGDFFSKKAYNQAIVDYNTNHIPGYLRTRAEYMADTNYGDKKAGSLYEALNNDFHVVRHLRTSEGRVDFLSRIGGYAGYEAGEWEVQSLVGNAILRTVLMGEAANGALTGKTLSVRDAHVYDSNTGKLTLLPGYVYLEKDGTIANDQKRAKHLITNRIHETNDRIHGNYDPANRIMLERNFAGKLILQFHKWIFPNLKARYQAAKFDENLGGGMDIEGRYRTLLGFIKSLHKLGVSTDRWAELTDHQRSNLKKDLADAIYVIGLFAVAYLIKKATEDLGDDDPYTKRMRNLVLYQLDRGIQEVSIFIPGWNAVESYNMITNPIAAANTLKNFSILLKDMVQFPFVDDEHRYIQRGNFKEESKVYKDFLKTFPGGGNVMKITNAYTISSFYLGK